MYMSNTQTLDAWYLINISAYKIAGRYLRDRGHDPLMNLSKSELWWERRIAILAAYEWVRSGMFCAALSIAARHVNNSDISVREGAEWILREVGKKDRSALSEFLSNHVVESKVLCNILKIGQ
jgi:3-methyladenine DNA glycosylase AlkD